MSRVHGALARDRLVIATYLSAFTENRGQMNTSTPLPLGKVAVLGVPLRQLAALDVAQGLRQATRKSASTTLMAIEPLLSNWSSITMAQCWFVCRA